MRVRARTGLAAALAKVERALLRMPCAAVSAGAAKVRCLTAQRREGRIGVWDLETHRMCTDCAAYIHVMRAHIALTGRGLAEEPPAEVRRLRELFTRTEEMLASGLELARASDRRADAKYLTAALNYLRGVTRHAAR